MPRPHWEQSLIAKSRVLRRLRQELDGLRDRLERLLDSPELRCEMGRRGRERVCAHFNMEACVQQGLRIIRCIGFRQ